MRRKDREINDINEIEAIIKSADVCRVALANDNEPYIVTFNFGYQAAPERKLYFHCATTGKKIEMIEKNNYVCFEFDTNHAIKEGETACDYSMGYRSVVGWGRITVVREREEKLRGLDILMAHYGWKKEQNYNEDNLERILVLCLEISSMTGKSTG